MDKLSSSLQALSMGEATVKGIGTLKRTTSTLHYSSRIPPPSLQDLPVELQGLILSSLPNFQSLSALVHASPDMHRVYAGDRLRILRSVLHNALEGMLVEALGTHHSGSNIFQESLEESLLWAFIREQETKHAMAEGDLTAHLSFEDTIDLLRFHVHVVEPLTELYASWALASLPIESEEEEGRQQPLSGTERRRIQRAMYQLQLFCNLCGSRGQGSIHPNRMEGNLEHLRVLLTFPPWEIERILCINEFAVSIYEDVFKQVAWDLNMDKNPKYRYLDMTETIDELMLISESEYGTYANDRSLKGVLRHGPQLLIQTIKTEDHEDLVNRIRDAIMSGEDGGYGSYLTSDWLDDAVDDLRQDERRERWYSHRDSAQDFRHKMPFDGDTLDSPPLAWVLYWQGEYSNLIGVYIHSELRRWGYAMWDAARLGPRARARIDYWSYNVCGGTQDQDVRSDDYDDSVRDVPREDCFYP